MTKPLRIAFFLHEFPALSETFVLNQITGLIDLGHDVTILAERPRAEPIKHPDVGAYRLAERTVYFDMPDARLERINMIPKKLGQGGNWATLLRSLDWRRYNGEARSLRLFYWAATLAGQKPFDVIHCHFGPRGRMAAFLREIGAVSGKLATVFHGVDMSAYLRGEPDIYRHLFSHGDIFLPISQTWHGRLLNHGCDPARTIVHRMGVNLQRFPFRMPRRNSGQALRVLTIGRLIEKKGIDFGLLAVAELVRRKMKVHYTIAGDGVERAGLESFAEELGIARHVTFAGWQDQHGVAQMMLEHDVLLAPSVTDSIGDQEGIPVTLMEAMATGLPVIATRHSGIPELIEDGVSGVLVAERDTAGLADALNHFRDAGFSMRIAQEARERIAADYDVQKLNRTLVEHYRNLLGQCEAARTTAGERQAAPAA
jgi:colanic acid/amylovoran/stewartan biosynthesis glycosyltransferase WcaL/AmsK/CpsK